ncbi:hypothetical protein CC2G_015220 [Coprinopsis cinerea AmutBmut pab1-1]|nr:hypothetical protein CC2G_015220 [Coprinopsis cinerea AmutBmut pab1-1]
MSTYHSSSDEEHVQQSGYTFRPSHQSFLREKLDGYVGAEKKKKSKYVKKVASHLQKEIEESSGNEMTQEEFRRLKEAVRLWFQHQSGPQKKLKEIWDCRWNSRLVFMRLNAAKIKALAHRMVGGEVDVDQFLEDWDRGEVDDVDGEQGKGRNPKTKGKKGGEDDWFFNHYQAAASLLIKELPETEKAHYAAVAEKWKKQGPPEEQQSKLADKAATKKAYSFAKFVDKQLNGVAVMLLGWKGEDGKPTAVKVEFTEELGRGPNFIDVQQKKIESMFRDFKSYVWKLYNDDSDAEEDDWVKTKNLKKPIMEMRTNEYGSPSFPTPIPGRWASSGGLVCSCLAILLHLPLRPEHVRFPWSKLEENKRAFIKPGFLPDDCLDLLKEPSDMKVAARVQVFDYLYERQREARNDLEMEIFINRVRKEDSARGRGRDEEPVSHGSKKRKKGDSDRREDSNLGAEKTPRSHTMNNLQASAAKNPFQLRFSRWINDDGDHDSRSGVAGQDRYDDLGGDGDHGGQDDGMGSDDIGRNCNDDFGGDG